MILLASLKACEPVTSGLPGNVEPEYGRNQENEDRNNRNSALSQKLNRRNQSDEHPTFDSGQTGEGSEDRGGNPASPQDKIETCRDKECVGHVGHRRGWNKNMQRVQRNQHKCEQRCRSIRRQLQSNAVNKQADSNSKNRWDDFAHIESITHEDVHDRANELIKR